MSQEYQMPIKVHRKYAVYSKFLDTVLESESVMQDGETRQQALTRLRRELDATADEWRREATVNGQIQDVQEHPFVPGQTPYLPVISKDDERMEIEIDNCSTFEELVRWKQLHDVLPGKIVAYYSKRLKELSV
jgi:hypothetical protein